jgi:sirohydrochlorin ferrochelatase
VVAPYFLSKGRHIQDDIPALVAAAREQFPGVACSIADPIGGCNKPHIHVQSLPSSWWVLTESC